MAKYSSLNALKITDDVSLPANTSTQSITILAKRRVGKSYLMRRIWEQLLKNKQHVAVVDPKGDQWGIRSSANGKHPGFPVLILGGGHGDLPLEKSSGELVARLIVEGQVNVLLDTSGFSKSARAVFMADFLENLYRLKAQEQYRTPLCVLIDEADEIAPQHPQKDEWRMLGAVDDIVRRGGQRGLGSILVTQRSASLNKNVLTQSEMLILLRTIAPHDLAAVKAWIDVHGTPEQQKIIMSELPSLPRGDAYFWSPAWPTDDGMFMRSHVLPIETFDSAKTPEDGEKRVIPKNIADVDLDALKGQMAATVEKVKADNPSLLRQEISRLRLELDKRQIKVIPQTIEKPEKSAILKDGQLKKLEELLEKIHTESIRHSSAMNKLIERLEDATAHVLPAKVGSTALVLPPIIFPDRPSPTDGSSGVSKPKQNILNALAWLSSAGFQDTGRTQLAALVQKSPHSSGYERNLTELKSAGYIAYPSPGKVQATLEGKRLAVYPTQKVTSEDIQVRAKAVVSKPQSDIISALILSYPNDLSREDLAAAVGKNSFSSGFERNLTDLRSAGFIEYPNPGYVRAAGIFFI